MMEEEVLKGVEVQGTFRIMSLPVESKEGISMEIERPPAPGERGEGERGRGEIRF